jgi:CrcB protein
MNRNILLVGIGGFIGSVARYLVGVVFAEQFTSTFPLGTFVVNITGCFIIGLLFELSDRGNILSPDLRIFVTTGFCGGFTTFSTFSYESIRLLQGAEFLYFGLNLFLSVMIGLAATYLGILLVRSL